MTDLTNTKIRTAGNAASTDFNELRKEACVLQKKGVPFMMASVVIWTLVTIVRMLPADIMTRNMYTFYCTGLLLPCVLIFGKITGAKIFSKSRNPINKLGFLCTMNQMLYLLIVMWAFSQKPDAMLMLFAMVFGAHLLPFSWVYDSKTYLVMSLLTTFGSMLISIFAPEVYVGVFMILCQTVMSVLLLIECRRLDRAKKESNEL
ncbi:DUF7010 family protein [Butyrivibrio sp. AE2032]|uniref:DUF7010 family protein n=1 Tax=Butyrivibrio sp. AE2032 TaxID=1458463 RepID=UPI00068ED5DE|nr:hypothetical protein [Butyrivibrio sp. AE2032]